MAPLLTALTVLRKPDWLTTPRGNRTKIAYLDADGQPVLHELRGYARRVQAYDHRNRLIKEQFFGDDAELISIKNGGYAIRLLDYDVRGNLIAEAYRDVHGVPTRVARAVYERDVRHRVRNISYFRSNGSQMRVHAQLRTVFLGTLAFSAGLRSGDVVVSYFNETIRSAQHLRYLTTVGQSETRSLTILRQGQTVSFEVPKGSFGVNLRNLFGKLPRRRKKSPHRFPLPPR